MWDDDYISANTDSEGNITLIEDSLNADNRDQWIFD